MVLWLVQVLLIQESNYECKAISRFTPDDLTKKEISMIGTFNNRQLYIELRPQCPKCKKEFMLDLKKFLPGKAHSCYACGTVAQFDSQIAERVQKLVYDLEASIQEVNISLSSSKTD
jgi:protein-arginine kinase activator protein McsA